MVNPPTRIRWRSRWSTFQTRMIRRFLTCQSLRQWTMHNWRYRNALTAAAARVNLHYSLIEIQMTACVTRSTCSCQRVKLFPSSTRIIWFSRASMKVQVHGLRSSLRIRRNSTLRIWWMFKMKSMPNKWLLMTKRTVYQKPKKLKICWSNSTQTRSARTSNPP